jgi:putative peptide zinc metalloprotease protein
LAAILLLPVLHLPLAFVHELAHALATKHYGREVPRAGFVLGGLCCLAQVAVEPGTLVSGLLYQAAWIGYVEGALNLLLLLELDGYYLLVDVLEMPGLRPRSFAFLRRELPGRLARRERLVGDERILVAYGLLGAACTALALVLALAFWWGQLRPLLGGP